MRLTLVRHGETPWNRDRKIQGVSDIELSDAGIEQARKLSLLLQHESFDHIATSPLRRAYATALEIGKYHSVPITVEPSLSELNVGDLEGRTYQDLVGKYTHFLNRWKLDRTSVSLPNGESLQDVQNRAWPVIEEIAKNKTNALVVSHSFVIVTLLCKLQDLSLTNSADIRVSVGSRTCVDIENGKAEILLLNDTGHLRNPGGKP